jgi:hypothetical protein
MARGEVRQSYGDRDEEDVEHETKLSDSGAGTGEPLSGGPSGAAPNGWGGSKAPSRPDTYDGLREPRLTN